MLNGRPKQGHIDIDWRSMALGKKYQRKTIGFGVYSKKEKEYSHEIYIRELCVASGALGCALWDGGVVLARWIFDNGAAFQGKTVLELGSGCGLPGIVAAHYAAHVTLTDYIEPVLENLRYNVRLNSKDSDADAGTDSAQQDELEDAGWPMVSDGITGTPTPWRRNLTAHVTVGYLDWDAVALAASASSAGSPSTTPASLVAAAPDVSPPKPAAAPLKQCSILASGREFHEQDWYHCHDCHGKDMSQGCCTGCAETCHAAHNIQFMERSRFRCDCYDSGQCIFEQQKQTKGVNVAIQPVDIIIGAELTYSLLSVNSLIEVVDKYLKPDGVFYEVLSEDRDGVSEFVARIQQRGFVVHSVPVPEKYMGNYSTRQWTYQDTEKYRFYSFCRPDAQHRSME